MKETWDAAVKRLLPKITRMAKRFGAQYPSIAADDLQQVGTQGAFKAWERYDDTKRAKLETFAHPWIRGEMLMHARKDAGTRRYERKVTDAVESVFERHDLGCGNSLADSLSEAIDILAADAYSHRTPEDEMVTRETVASIEAFFSELSERDREFARLRYTEALTLVEIGLALRYSPSALCRLDEKLREQLRSHLARGG